MLPVKEELILFAYEHQVELVAKRHSMLMKVIDKLLSITGNKVFMTNYWTTIGKTIYYPDYAVDPFEHTKVLTHEFVHVKQWEQYGLLFMGSYLLLPLPVGLAWFRWRWEREAYLTGFARDGGEADRQEVERIVENLWHDYGWTWPKAWMRAWFYKQLGMEVE